MTFANYCFIPPYCTFTDQSCKTSSETILAAIDFKAWRRKLDVRGEHCCYLHNVTTYTCVTVLFGELFTLLGPILSIFCYTFANYGHILTLEGPTSLKRCIGKWQIYWRNLERFSFVYTWKKMGYSE